MTYSLSCAAGALLITGQTARRGSSSFCAINTTALWFPVAPGVTSLPAGPAEVINPAPVAANQATLPGDWDDDAPDLCYLFQDILPVDVPPVFPVELTVSYLHPPFLETVEAVGIVKTKLVVGDLPYALTLTGETVVARVRTRLTLIVGILTADAGAINVTGQDAALSIVLRMEANSGEFQLLGEDVNLYSTAPNYTLACGSGAFTVTGQEAGPFRLFADAGRYELQGMNITSLAEKTKLILHFDGTSGSTFFENQAQNNKLTAEVYGSAAIATDFKKWGTGSGRFSFPTSGAGYTGHAVAFDDPVLAPGTDDFTIECWIYIPTDDLIRSETIAQLPNTNPGRGRLRVSGSAELIWTGGTSGEVIHQTAITYDVWHHVWMVRESGTVKIALDGVQASSTLSDTTDFPFTPGYSGRKLIIGNYTTGSTYGFGGRIDDLRFTVGTARPLAVPTGPYPNE